MGFRRVRKKPVGEMDELPSPLTPITPAISMLTVPAQASHSLAGIAGIAIPVQASHLLRKTVLQASPCLCRHRICLGKLDCRHRHVSAGIAFAEENGLQAPHPVWGFKYLEGGRCRGEAVANATAVRIEGSIVCKTGFQTG